MALGEATTATLEFCAVASTNSDAPLDLIVGPAGPFTGFSGIIDVGTPANGATFSVLGAAPTYVLVSSGYPSLPSTPGKFGSLILNNNWQLTFDLSVPPAASANPADKNACMKDGFQTFKFKNQGQCVRFVETGKDSRSLPTP